MYHYELVAHLAALIHQGLLEIWAPHQILPGVVQGSEINLHISTADIILLMGSRYFFNSDSHWHIMEQSLELHRVGKAHVVPVRARPYDYTATPLGELQLLPRKKPLSKLLNRDEGYVEIAEGVRQVMLELQNTRKMENNTVDTPKTQIPEDFSLEQLVAISISDPSHFIEKGDILSKRQQYDEALIAYEDALRLDPTCIAAYLGQAQVLKKLKSLAYGKLNQLIMPPSERTRPQEDTQEDLE